MLTERIKRRQILIYAGTIAICSVSGGSVLARNISAYGISPNSKRDQSAAFQAMLNDGARANSVIGLPAGRYILSKINIPDGCQLVGDGDATVLVANSNGPLLSARHAGFISITDLSIDAGQSRATSENQGVIDLRHVSNANLSGIKIDGGNRDGIYIETCGGRIDRCKTSNMERFGIFAVQGTGLAVEDNDVRDCNNGGIVVQRWDPGFDGTRIERNRVRNIRAKRGGTGQWGNGINVFQAHDVIVNQNDLEGCAFSAIRMNGAHNTAITNNRCLKSGETAIYAEFAYRDVRIVGNMIDGAANGISATNLNNGGRGAIITNNRLRNIKAPGPYQPEPPFFGHGITVEADAVVTDNLIESAKGYGINVGWGPYLDNVEVRNNLISKARIGIGVSVADGAGEVRVIGNKINALDGYIKAHRWNEVSNIDLGLHPELAPKTISLARNTIL